MAVHHDRFQNLMAHCLLSVSLAMAHSSIVLAGPVHDAAKAGNLKALQEAVAKISINDQDEKGYTALHWAVAEGKIELVTWLLKNGANVSTRAKDEMTPLLLAGKHGRPQTAIYLIQAGAYVHDVVTERVDPSSADYAYGSNQHLSAVSLAAMNGHPEVIKVLLDRGADANGVKRQSEMGGYPDYYAPPFPIDLAVRHGHREVIKVLVERGSMTHGAVRAAILGKNQEMLKYLASLGVKFDSSAVYEATAGSDATLIQYLLDNGATVGADSLLRAIDKNDASFTTFMLKRVKRDQYIEALKSIAHRANVYSGGSVPDIRIIQLLLDHDPEAAREVPTLLHAAATNDATGAINLILSRGFPVNARDEFGNTALHWAAQQGHAESVKLLLERGINVSARSDRGNTALHRAITGVYTFGRDLHAVKLTGQQLDVVNLLLSAKVDVNARNDAGNTALHMAALRGYVDLISLLVKKGASVSARNEHGLEPIHAAAALGFPQGMKSLLDLGGNPSATSNLGTTPLHHAVSGKYSFYKQDKSWYFGYLDNQSISAPERIAMIQTLLNQRINVNARSDHFATPLHLAVWGNYRVSENLLNYCCEEYGGPFRDKDRQMSVINLLLRAGANQYIKDTSSPPLTVQDIASRIRDRKEILGMLKAVERWGGSVNNVNEGPKK